jgi:hypothetical protein
VELRKLRIYWRAFAEFLKIVGDDEGAAGKTAFDDPAIAILRTECHAIQMNRIAGAYGKDLLLALKLRNRRLWDQNCIATNLGLCLHPAELAGT